MRGDGPDWLDPEHGYTFLVLAAHEARKASRGYWAPGSPADKRYSVLPSAGWPEPAEASRSTVVAVEDIRERARRRRR